MTDLQKLQRSTVWVLASAQVVGGLGIGATVSVGALLAASVSGSDAWSGMAATMSTLGAAVLALPLARFAASRGRRAALGTGSALAAASAVLLVVAASAGSFPLLLLAFALAGAGSATNLQARFAATDLALPAHRGRDLSLVVWSTTIGSVLGPNLIEPGEAIGRVLGLPELTGPFVFTLVAQLLTVTIYAVGLRPDPLLTARAALGAVTAERPRLGFSTLRVNGRARFSVGAVALSHATMVAVMSMTPVHLYGHGATLAIVGFTISLHIAGMYALSPVFGWLADRLGRLPVLLGGQALLLVSLVLTWVGSESHELVVLSLVLLGLGWSASTISASTMLVDSVPVGDRPGVQGVSDLCMNLAGAAGGALAGPVLTAFGYSGLGVACMALVAGVVVWALLRASARVTLPQP
ncbi:putative MFS family arabinose efflux permease [Homoserinimonas aerilata]|uniref:Putative MFS family arabinose efflux permease n=1 Tax=Homoserinimonas aerilata TaxID=1162970 RepID=A0A542YHU2_9MICO|nr:MFS transporter [Homoserinimonas aerilata]TQL47591.1 putative MFS family arabinose efflux permease [Homoserinimonas aerilata]